MVDRLEDIASTVQNLTIYDVKSWYNKGKAFVMNYTEMETKVREATNDDPWGASSTLMAEIAQGTFNYQQFNEIMPTVYSRFMEKEARQWRQIFKALQLLEYLIKNGSERVVDDCRSHVSTVKMLRSFHYIDDKGKDQGINIRHRSKEITELLNDLDAIRVERKKAKSNRAKYQGDGAGFGGTGKKYGGFGGGADQYGSYGDSSYDGRTTSQDNGYGGGESTFHDSGRTQSFSQSQQSGFEEYDAGDEEDDSAKRKVGSEVRSPPPSAKPKEVVQDLFNFGDDEDVPPVAAEAAFDDFVSDAAGPMPVEDDFDDFQSAPAGFDAASVSKPTVKPMPAKPATDTSFDLFLQGPSKPSTGFAPILSPPVVTAQSQPMGSQNAIAISPQATGTARPSQTRSTSGLVMDRRGMVSHASPRQAIPSSGPQGAVSSGPFGSDAPKPSAQKTTGMSNDGFADLWASTKVANGGVSNGKGKETMASLAQRNTSNQIWNAPQTNPSMASKPSQPKNDLDDLLF